MWELLKVIANYLFDKEYVPERLKNTKEKNNKTQEKKRTSFEK